ncbi:hypothetical protein RFI_01325 [Reticulomyxa filosa]|uniref:Uncharacterized protein n=1 Tax=Reticulomyxa filosa TaxID=46433 RepID=X6PC31_RETFI|nr:hypothetical protein RFI_01325 [Reticulomyxa filosa]|eukprot:ETO35736.1 hypothetical protein RFI_01325 [Reticulomyxa filosa]
MGALKSGKTSIERVVFHKMEPHQTLYNVQSTREIRMTLIQYNPLVQFQIVDFPGSFDCSDPDVRPAEIFAYCSVLVFVVDAQDRPYTDALKYVVSTIEIAHSVNKSIQFFLLIHKVDVETFFSNENKFRTRHDIQFKIFEQLTEINLSELTVDYELTSIYDQSIFEALSKVVKQLIPKDKCDIEKAYIFDVPSKLYIAKDSSPIDFEAISLCSDMIDIVMDLSGIYGGYQSAPAGNASALATHQSGFDEESDAFITLQSNSNNQILMLREVGQLKHFIIIIIIIFCTYCKFAMGSYNFCVFAKSTYKLKYTSHRYLALVCLMKKAGNKGLLEYNFKVFRNQIQKLLKMNEDFQKKSKIKSTGGLSETINETDSKSNIENTLNGTTSKKSSATIPSLDNYSTEKNFSGDDIEGMLIMDPPSDTSGKIDKNVTSGNL